MSTWLHVVHNRVNKVFLLNYLDSLFGAGDQITNFHTIYW